MCKNDDVYKTIKSQSQGAYSEKGSKFLAFAYPVRNQNEIKKHLNALKKKYYDARHHVYAFVLNPDMSEYRASDDGEPANSSGMPVLGQIRSFGLTNVVIIVVRYFGGTKLGVPGLINAYKTAAQDALNNAKIIDEYVLENYRIIFHYEEMSFVMRTLKEFDAKITLQEFVEDCKIEFLIRQSLLEKILFSLKQNHKIKLEEIYV